MLYLYIHIESRALRIPSADSWYKVKVSRDLSNSAKDLKKKRTKHRTSAREKTIYNYCAMSRESVSGGFSTIFIFWPCSGEMIQFHEYALNCVEATNRVIFWNLKRFHTKKPSFSEGHRDQWHQRPFRSARSREGGLAGTEILMGCNRW